MPLGLRVSLLTVGLALWAGPAWADDAATAGALFDKGVADMQAGHFESACPALEESQQLDPHPGTLFTLAECQNKWGKVASAVAHYQDYIGMVPRLPAAQQTRHRDRVATSNEQLNRLRPTVPKLTLSLPANAPPGTTVTRNGVDLQGAALGIALPVDPGEYVIVTRVPGGEDHSITVKIALGEAKRVQLEVRLKPAAPAAGATPEKGAESTEAGTSSSESHGASRTPAYVAGGIGIAGIALGSITGVLVLGKASTVKSHCTGTNCPAQSDVDTANSGKSLALISDIGFAVGAAGLVTSVILLATRAKSEPVARVSPAHWQPLLAGTPGGAWAGLERRW
jgi:hypothetical protein